MGGPARLPVGAEHGEAERTGVGRGVGHRLVGLIQSKLRDLELGQIDQPGADQPDHAGHGVALIHPLAAHGDVLVHQPVVVQRQIGPDAAHQHRPPARPDGERILRRIEQRARAAGLDSIFVLTTRTMHWFIKRGFVQVDPDWLPEARKRKYNWDRKSQVLIKKLGA